MGQDLELHIEGIAREKADLVLQIVIMLINALGGSAAGGIVEAGDETKKTE
jgi:hypothetical protein